MGRLYGINGGAWPARVAAGFAATSKFPNIGSARGARRTSFAQLDEVGWEMMYEWSKVTLFPICACPRGHRPVKYLPRSRAVWRTPSTCMPPRNRVVRCSNVLCGSCDKFNPRTSQARTASASEAGALADRAQLRLSQRELTANVCPPRRISKLTVSPGPRSGCPLEVERPAYTRRTHAYDCHQPECRAAGPTGLIDAFHAERPVGASSPSVTRP